MMYAEKYVLGSRNRSRVSVIVKVEQVFARRYIKDDLLERNNIFSRILIIRIVQLIPNIKPKRESS